MNHPIRIALIPAYEPDRNFPHFVERLAEAGFCPVVVDDGSGPDYRAVFTAVSRSAYVLKHETNRGKGAALKTGLTYIRDSIPFILTVVTVDADGQHRVEDAVKVAEASEENPQALVIGGRRFTGKVPLRSQFGNTVTRFVFRKVSGVSIFDTQTGLRAFSSEMIGRMLSISGERYEYEMNQLLYYGKRRLKIIEVPIVTVYKKGNRSSHFDTIKDSWRIYTNIFRFMKA